MPDEPHCRADGRTASVENVKNRAGLPSFPQPSRDTLNLCSCILRACNDHHLALVGDASQSSTPGPRRLLTYYLP